MIKKCRMCLAVLGYDFGMVQFKFTNMDETYTDISDCTYFLCENCHDNTMTFVNRNRVNEDEND